MNQTPRLSIGLPVYNGKKYLAEAIDALLGQSYEDFELILSDNASTDDTEAICRRYEKQDSRVRYFRQSRNIGISANHDFVFQQSRGELFKWAAADDLYGRDLLKSCVDALDKHPEVVLAHSWVAAIDEAGHVTQALEYPLVTDSPSAPERFGTTLFGSSGLYQRRVLYAGGGLPGGNDADIRGLIRVDNRGVIRSDDQYGVIRSEVLRRVPPVGSYHHGDLVMTSEIALHGPFHMTPDWLYFRRQHPDRSYNASSKVQARCAIQDPARANRLLHPTARLHAEYILGYVAAIRRAPLTSADRRQCYRYLAKWMLDRAACRAFPGHFGKVEEQPSPGRGNQTVSVDAVVAGHPGVRSRGCQVPAVGDEQ